MVTLLSNPRRLPVSPDVLVVGDHDRAVGAEGETVPREQSRRGRGRRTGGNGEEGLRIGERAVGPRQVQPAGVNVAGQPGQEHLAGGQVAGDNKCPGALRREAQSVVAPGHAAYG